LSGLKWRKTIDKETQDSILTELKKIASFKTWLGIKWLCTYINMRPGDLRGITEGHIDLTQGEILIPDPKERRPKIVYLLKEDVELIKTLPRGMPHLYFFRHPNGERFGEKYFYKWWKRACRKLDIENVDLYGGTRHSSCRALRRYRTPEEIRAATMHTTDKSFERYFRTEGDDLRGVYSDTVLTKRSRGVKKSK
jgi:integrase